MAPIRIIILSLLAFTSLPAFSHQPAASFLLTKEWKASWIAVPGTSPDGYGVYWSEKPSISRPSLHYSRYTCPATIVINYM